MVTFSSAECSYLSGTAKVLLSIPDSDVYRLAVAVNDCRLGGGTVFTAGNGACASLADHMAADFSKSDMLLRRPAGERALRMYSLASNAAALTAASNDLGYEEVFSSQVEGRIGSADLVIALSGSGKSPNIIRVVRVALAAGARAVAITGRMFEVNPLLELVEASVVADSDQIDQIEDAHVAVHHAALRAYLKIAA